MIIPRAPSGGARSNRHNTRTTTSRGQIKPSRWGQTNLSEPHIAVHLGSSGCARTRHPQIRPKVCGVYEECQVEAPFGLVCKTVGLAYVGSNPTPATS